MFISGEIWNSSEKHDKLSMFCVSLLNVELLIRSWIQNDVGRSMAYLCDNFPNESVQTFVQLKNIEGPSAVYINKATQYTSLRFDVVYIISLANKKDKKATTQYEGNRHIRQRKK